MLRSALTLICLTLCFGITPSLARAQGQTPSIIRDTEIEATLKEWFAPVLEAAGMGKDSVNIILVQSDQVNAFVAGGANVFLFTGLIEKTETPGELIGVFAHELGHIAGGHLIRQRKAMERASYESILGAVVGIGAAIASGNGAAASAIMSGSSNIAQKRFLANSRVNESSADQAAFRVLEAAKMNPEGLVTFLQKLESDELLPSDQQSEYIRTHPLTRNRVQAVETKAKNSAYYGKAWPASWTEAHKRMKAKLTGFTDPGGVPWVYDDQSGSIPAQYAHAIAAYRQSETGKALEGIDALIRKEPQNPYFHELKGQMLVDFGRLNEALEPYQTALKYKPDAPLIRVAYAHTLLEKDQTEQSANQAIKQLEQVIHEEPRLARAHNLMARAYGRLGQTGMARYYSAEEASLRGRYDLAERQAEGALQSLPENSREWLKARDLLEFIKNKDDTNE